MCKCDPERRTPFCGALGCEWPKPEGTRLAPGSASPPERPTPAVEVAEMWREQYERCAAMLTDAKNDLANTGRALASAEARAEAAESSLSALREGVARLLDTWDEPRFGGPTRPDSCFYNDLDRHRDALRALLGGGDAQKENGR